MKSLKFLHFGDLHLDMPFTALGDAQFKSTLRRHELKECFARIIDLAKEVKAGAVLISGDLLEHAYVKKSTVNFVNDKFCEIPDVRIFIVPGNHDPYTADSYYRNFKWNENVTILAGEKTKIYLEEYGACIYGAGFSSFYEKESLISKIKNVDRSFINILLVHGTVDMNLEQNGYNPMTSEELSALGMDYIALGHFHTRIYGAGKRKEIYNAGSPEPLGFDEPGEHGVYVGEVVKGATDFEGSLKVNFVKTGKRFYRSLEIHAGGAGSTEQIIERINRVFGTEELKEELSEGLFDINLKGFVEEGFKPDLLQIRNSFSKRTFLFKIKDETSVSYDIEGFLKEPGLRGLFTRKMMSMIDMAEDDKVREQAREALYLGLQALEGRELEIDHMDRNI